MQCLSQRAKIQAEDIEHWLQHKPAAAPQVQHTPTITQNLLLGVKSWNKWCLLSFPLGLSSKHWGSLTNKCLLNERASMGCEQKVGFPLRKQENKKKKKKKNVQIHRRKSTCWFCNNTELLLFQTPGPAQNPYCSGTGMVNKHISHYKTSKGLIKSLALRHEFHCPRESHFFLYLLQGIYSIVGCFHNACCHTEGCGCPRVHPRFNKIRYFQKWLEWWNIVCLLKLLLIPGWDGLQVLRKPGLGFKMFLVSSRNGLEEKKKREKKKKTIQEWWVNSTKAGTINDSHRGNNYQFAKIFFSFCFFF